MTTLVGKRGDVGLLERDGMTERVTVVDAVAAKGLEFDAVVVVEPAAIAGTMTRGPTPALRSHDAADPAPEHRARRAPPALLLS